MKHLSIRGVPLGVSKQRPELRESEARREARRLFRNHNARVKYAARKEVAHGHEQRDRVD